MRQIALDTETTGLRTEDGHRIIEIGCVELVDRKLTGNNFHHYINPGREVEAEALAVHGISNDFLQDKPKFEKLARELLDYIAGAELIIHNAAFDLGFLNFEFKLARGGYKPVESYCEITDTLLMARKMHVGQRNNLDALCKRYGIDNSKRDLHGALMDASLLAQLYLAMTGGQGSFFDDADAGDNQENELQDKQIKTIAGKKLFVLQANEQEIQEHEKYLAFLQKQGECLWPINSKKSLEKIDESSK